MRWAIYFVLAILVGIFLYNQLSMRQPQPDIMSLQDLAAEIKDGQVAAISVEGTTLDIELVGGSNATAYKEDGADLIKTLNNLGISQKALAKVTIEFVSPSGIFGWLGILSWVLPLILISAFFLIIFRQAQSSGNQAMSFGKSRARMFAGEKPTVTFDDVAGVEEAKQELSEIVEFLKEPQKFIALGARIPKGVILMGAPGTGKTLMAKAVSGEAGVPFFSISGSEFVEMFVGVGASRVRDLFDQAKRNSPCIVFVDEIDAVGRHRGAGLGGSHDEREQTLNQILVEMDGFDTDTNVIIVAATNRPDILDPALLRPGRFDRRVVLDRPDMNGRKKILEVHVRGKPLGRDVDLEALARQAPGFVGADIESLVNEAAILAARRNKKTIDMEEFQEAIERVIAGPERKSRVITEEEKEVVAYHEAGHALAAAQTPEADKVRKVTIIPRGMAGGYTMILPDEDRYLANRTKFEAELVTMLGGRAAEEVVFHRITTGASNDLERATELVRKMVMEYGMSHELGPMTYGEREEMVFLGRSIAEHRNYSESIARKIDVEVRQLISTAYSRALEVMTTHRDLLDRLAQQLIQHETLGEADVEALLASATG
ncbi:MAG TPA: ATP-dependent zinc metalloprotease FtsH [Anaerolineae bacterium]|nr:ATP-dependent zinc metalloprotease FtsH [Anaerolineae bacterium]